MSSVAVLREGVSPRPRSRLLTRDIEINIPLDSGYLSLRLIGAAAPHLRQKRKRSKSVTSCPRITIEVSKYISRILMCSSDLCEGIGAGLTPSHAPVGGGGEGAGRRLCASICARNMSRTDPKPRGPFILGQPPDAPEIISVIYAIGMMKRRRKAFASASMLLCDKAAASFPLSSSLPYWSTP